MVDVKSGFAMGHLMVESLVWIWLLEAESAMKTGQQSGIKIVSRGQSGVDRAALDMALKQGFACGGWCPKGRASDDGTISTRYPLFQTSAEDDQESIEWNVRDSDGTLVLALGRPGADTALAIEFAVTHRRPCLVIDLAVPVNRNAATQWLVKNRIRTLFVTGPTATQHPEIYDLAALFLQGMLGEDAA